MGIVNPLESLLRAPPNPDTATPSFEVASVKPADPALSITIAMEYLPNGGPRLINTSLKEMVGLEGTGRKWLPILDAFRTLAA